MNKKILVPVIIIVLILLGGGALVMKNKSAHTQVNPTPAPAAAAPTKATAAQAQGTLKSLLTSGVAQTCTFTNQKQATTNGTIFVAGGKMRGDFTSTNQGQTVSGHIILNAGYSYVWTDMTKQGMKIALTEQQASGSANSQSMDVNQTVSYSCKPWAPDASKFTLPADITFTTFTMPGAAAGGTVTSPGITATSECGACDSLPAAAQTACKTQLHCQ